MLKKVLLTPCEKIFLHGGMLIMDKELDEKRILQKKIIKMVEKIENQEFLRFLYQTLQSFKKKWGI